MTDPQIGDTAYWFIEGTGKPWSTWKYIGGGVWECIDHEKGSDYYRGNTFPWPVYEQVDSERGRVWRVRWYRPGEKQEW